MHLYEKCTIKKQNGTNLHHSSFPLSTTGIAVRLSTYLFLAFETITHRPNQKAITETFQSVSASQAFFPAFTQKPNWKHCLVRKCKKEKLVVIKYAQKNRDIPSLFCTKRNLDGQTLLEFQLTLKCAGCSDCSVNGCVQYLHESL